MRRTEVVRRSGKSVDAFGMHPEPIEFTDE
jgi:hypothetical protein